jgi:hypothetical protein
MKSTYNEHVKRVIARSALPPENGGEEDTPPRHTNEVNT